MTQEGDEIRARIDRRLKALGLSMRDASLRAGLNEGAVRDLKRRSTNARIGTFAKLAPVLGTTEEWLINGTGPEEIASGVPPVVALPAVGDVRPSDVRMPDPDVFPRDLPVHGTVAASVINGKDTFEIEQVIDYVRRPPSLAKVRDAYALFVTGESMVPMYRPGDLVMVHPYKPPAVGDTVIVQLRGDPPQGFIKVLVGRTPEYLLLQQLNPVATIKCKHESIKAVHKVMTLAELMAW